MNEIELRQAVYRRLEAYRDELAIIGGCGDGGCIIVRPKGQHTNGGCKCNHEYVKMARVVRAARRLCEELDQDALS